MMAYNYLGLVNEVCRRLNETELTSTSFAGANGFYSQVKDSINAAIRDVNQKHFNWQFNHNTDELTLTAGELRYPLPMKQSTQILTQCVFSVTLRWVSERHVSWEC